VLHSRTTLCSKTASAITPLSKPRGNIDRVSPEKHLNFHKLDPKEARLDTDQAMAHSQSETLTKPMHFNFAQDVVDYWAARDKDQEAMFWVSEDYKIERSLSYSHFKMHSYRIASLFQHLGVQAGDVILMVVPRIPEW
jgi:hypothetical protein